MADRPPTPFEAGDDDPTPARGAPSTTASADTGSWDDRGVEEWDEPNYLLRRGFVVGGVVAAIAVVAIGAGQLIGGDDADSPWSAASAEWNTIVVLTSDEITLLESGGDEVNAFDASEDLLDAQSLVTGNVLVTMTDEGRINQTDLSDETQRRGRSGPDETLRISPDNPQIAISGPDVGGDVTLIDTRDRSLMSVADVAGLDDPLIFGEQVIINQNATHVAVPVPNAFQSVVINLANETSQARAGRVIAIDDARLVTEQPAGDQSELEFYSLDGERLGAVDVPAPHATLLRSDGTLLSVAEDGTISTVDVDGSVDDVNALIDPEGRAVDVSSGLRVADGDRLLVGTGRNTYVVDTDGNQLGVAPGEASPAPSSGARCAVIMTTDPTSSTSVIDLETGAILTEVAGSFATDTSYDGCTVSFQGAGSQLFVAGNLVNVDADSISAVAPDGAGFIVLDGRESKYVTLDDDSISLADRPAVIHFGERE